MGHKKYQSKYIYTNLTFESHPQRGIGLVTLLLIWLAVTCGIVLGWFKIWFKVPTVPLFGAGLMPDISEEKKIQLLEH